MKQQAFFKNQSKQYGGILLNTRKGRSHGRPLATKNSMHLVLRSSKATKDWSFRKPKNQALINKIVAQFSRKFGVRVLDLANVGNHLHFHIQLRNRHTYPKWIRAVTAAIAMGITGMNRWTGGKSHPGDKFWDYRPFTRVVQGFRDFLNLQDYILINKFEGMGIERKRAREVVNWKTRNCSD